ncbi:putative [Escherichia phage Mu]|uniref:Bacteriophage Mu left end n=1 Tax=Escherichia phage Mu TaxID=2681603 RepID=Q38495_BPMU|nr:putative [Escherichia phage Mu]
MPESVTYPRRDCQDVPGWCHPANHQINLPSLCHPPCLSGMGISRRHGIIAAQFTTGRTDRQWKPVTGKGFTNTADVPLLECFEDCQQRVAMTPRQCGNALSAVAFRGQALNIFIQRHITAIGNKTVFCHLLPDFIHLLTGRDMPLKAATGVFILLLKAAFFHGTEHLFQLRDRQLAATDFARFLHQKSAVSVVVEL